MNNIFLSYFVHEGNNALLPARHMKYSTIILSAYEKIYVNRTPLEIIKDSCYRDFATYDARRKTVKKRTGYSNKLPIPISTSRNIFAFPTKSPTNPDCIWIFFHRIKDIEDTADNPDVDHRSVVHFIDGSFLPLDISFHTLKEQYERTKYCVALHESEQEMAFR